MNVGFPSLLGGNSPSSTSSGSTPTGTGIPHVVGGVQNAAASLVVDADVDAAAAIAGSKVTPTFGAQSIVTTGSLSLGTSPAAAGTIRLPIASQIQMNNSGADICMLSSGASNINVNATQTFTLQAATLNLCTTSTGTVYVACGSLSCTATFISGAVNNLQFYNTGDCLLSQRVLATNGATGAKITVQAQNATGTTSTGGDLTLTAGTGTSLYGSLNLLSPINAGFLTQAMADAPQTVSAANSVKNMIRATGANTAVRALTLTRPPTAGAMVFVRNDCTANGITVQFSSGAATATIAPATSVLVAGDGTNAFIMMTGT